MNRTSNNTINICFITDNGYALPTHVALCSLLTSKQATSKYHVFILCNKVEKAKRQEFQNLSTDNFQVSCVNVDSIKNLQNFRIDGIPATVTSIYKFYIPEILSDESRVIFLDGDVIVKNDLTELFNTDLGNKIVGAVKDLSGLNQFNKVNPNYSYFNSGIMLMDLKSMRDRELSTRMIDYRKNGYNTLMDQDTLNVVLKNDVMLLPFKYNTQISALMLNACKNRKCTMERMRAFWKLDKKTESAEDLINQAVIVHFTSMKPWKYYDSIGVDLWLKNYYSSVYGNDALNLQSKYIKEMTETTIFKAGTIITKPYVILNSMFKSLFRTKKQKFLSQFDNRKHHKKEGQS